MNKEVLVSISGLQFSNDDKDVLEVITIGDYYKRNGRHYLLFDDGRNRRYYKEYDKVQ